MTKKTQSFQAETKELLALMAHSLYSHREIFLRELVSNASDAIEKLKFESLTHPELVDQHQPFEIRLEADPEKHLLKVRDNGIGMTADEVVENIGTIAHSGTKAFLRMKAESQANPELIGQFGVGFYSAFMVADRIQVHTQKVGKTEGVIWESDGAGTYTLEDAPRPEGHGTTVTLFLKQKAKHQAGTVTGASLDSATDGDDSEVTQDFTDSWTLKQIIEKYSNFVATPIKMAVSREKPIAAPSGDKTDEHAHEHADDAKTETVIEDQTFNSQKALWLKSPQEVSETEYQDFYRQISRDWNAPLKTIHYRAEGTMEFTALLFLPSMRPFDYEYRDRKGGLSLYVKRIFIKGECEELLPAYLRFVKGMVDSDDLSLNVSRELLQQDRQIGRMKKAITHKILGALKDLLTQSRPDYQKLWSQFGSTLKEGIALEPGASEKIQEICLFHSTHSDELTTLQEYVARMKPEQKAIYYVTGDSLGQLKNSPYLEKVRSKGLETLLMVDKVDAWAADHFREFAGKSLQSIMSDQLDLLSDSEKAAESDQLKEAESKFKPLLQTMTEALKEQIKEVKLSKRLTDSAVCLVSEGSGSAAHMERLMKSMGQNIPVSKRILEINPDHPIYQKMLHLNTSQQVDWTDLLYQQALLNEGTPLENPLKFSQKISNLMLAAQRQPEA